MNATTNATDFAADSLAARFEIPAGCSGEWLVELTLLKAGVTPSICHGAVIVDAADFVELFDAVKFYRLHADLQIETYQMTNLSGRLCTRYTIRDMVALLVG